MNPSTNLKPKTNKNKGDTPKLDVSPLYLILKEQIDLPILFRILHMLHHNDESQCNRRNMSFHHIENEIEN